METEETMTLDINQIDPFVQKYRDTLKRSTDAQVLQLNAQREADQAKIMSQANTAGMMYSNFPTRSKMQYDTSTYNPNLLKIQSAYQTGLDSIRNKAVELANYLKQNEESIQDYNYYTSLLNQS